MSEPMTPASDTVSIEWEGATFTLPASPDDWPLDALEAFEDGKATQTARALLGPTQYVALRKVAKTVGDFTRFLNKVTETYGFDTAGN